MKLKIIHLVFYSLIPLLSIGQKLNNIDQYAKIKVRFNMAQKSDTIYLYYFSNVLNNVPNVTGDFKEVKATMEDDGLYHFKFPVNKHSGNFIIGKKYLQSDTVRLNMFVPISSSYYPEAGDDIVMDITQFKEKYFGSNGYQINFQGSGSTKYNVQQALETGDIGVKIKTTAIFNDQNEYIPENSNVMWFNAEIEYLESHKKQLSDLMYNVLKADIISNSINRLEGVVSYNYEIKLRNADPGYAEKAREKFLSEYNKFFLNIPDYGIPVAALLKSKRYIKCLLKKVANCDFVVNGRPRNEVYDYLKKNFSGEVRDLLLTTFFLQSNLRADKDPKYIQDAINVVKTTYCLKVLKKMSGLGSKAVYNFNLPNITGKEIRMNDFLGKVVLIDFWFTGCGACVRYYKNHLSKIESTFKDNPEVQFISICIDQNRAGWLKSIGDGEYTSTNVINLSTSNNNEGIIKYYNVTGFPTVILIGKNGELISYNNLNLYDTSSAIDMIRKAL